MSACSTPADSSLIKLAVSVMDGNISNKRQQQQQQQHHTNVEQDQQMGVCR
jgi:hypothetical protein